MITGVLIFILGVFGLILVSVSKGEVDSKALSPMVRDSFPDTLVLRIANFSKYDGVEMEREGMDWEADATCTLNDLIDECREYLEERR